MPDEKSSKVKALTPKQEDRRHRILSAARRIVADHGYEGMVMSQVAELAGVSPTTLYNLYNTKDQLVLESLRALITSTSRTVLAESKGMGWRYMYASVKGGGEMAQASPAYAEAIVVALQRAKAGDELVDVVFDGEAKGMRLSLEAMQERGELKANIDARELAISLTGLYWSSFILWNKGLVRLKTLDYVLKMNFLSMMIPSTQGETRDELEQLLEALG